MTDTTPTLVLGATGKTGRRVAQALDHRGATVRRASRSSATRFDWADPATWAPALAGARAAYIVPPDPGQRIDGWLEVARAEGLEHLVLLSARGPEQFGDLHYVEVEDAVEAWGGSWTVLRPAWFVQNFDEGDFAPMVAGGDLRLPLGDGREPYVDCADIAEVAAAALLDPNRHHGRTYELSGPELLTITEVAERISRLTGRSVGVTDVTPETFRAEAVAAGYPVEIAEMLDRILRPIRDGENAYLSDGVQQALGREPRAFADAFAVPVGEPAA